MNFEKVCQPNLTYFFYSSMTVGHNQLAFVPDQFFQAKNVPPTRVEHFWGRKHKTYYGRNLRISVIS